MDKNFLYLSSALSCGCSALSALLLSHQELQTGLYKPTCSSVWIDNSAGLLCSHGSSWRLQSSVVASPGAGRELQPPQLGGGLEFGLQEGDEVTCPAGMGWGTLLSAPGCFILEKERDALSWRCFFGQVPGLSCCSWCLAVPLASGGDEERTGVMQSRVPAQHVAMTGILCLFCHLNLKMKLWQQRTPCLAHFEASPFQQQQQGIVV